MALKADALPANRPTILKLTKDFKLVEKPKPMSMIVNEKNQAALSQARKGSRTSVVSRWSLG